MNAVRFNQVAVGNAWPMHHAVSHQLCLVFLFVTFIAGCSISQRPQPALDELKFQNACVAADHPVASAAGVEILKRGGNAVDAAVATSFCLSVVRPYSCGIGGGGFMLVYVPGKDGHDAHAVAINYRESAPAAVEPDTFARLADPNASRHGHHAVAVPGTVAGLAHALQHYGTMKLATVLQPAIRAAEQGVPADENYVAAAAELAREIEGTPSLVRLAAPIWHDLCRSGKVKVGDIIKQPQQARALRVIADKGPDAFYRGEIGHAIFAAMRTHGGPITMADLKDYKVREVQPLQGRFRDYDILSMPPPSSGGIAIQQIFGVLERILDRNEREALSQSRLVHNSPEYIHLVTEAMKHAFADRSRWLADPVFVDVPVQRLISSDYLDHLANSISMDGTRESREYGSSRPLNDDAGTSHFCVIDSTGMAVACTETINLTYGSLVTVPGFGFVLNNEMDDFTTVVDQPNAFGLAQSDLNVPAAGKRPLSSMSPTILVKEGKAALIAGGSGGPRINSGTMQCILNGVHFGMTPAQSVAAPRFHHQWMPDVLYLEQGAASDEVKRTLERHGHQIAPISNVAQVQVIQVSTDGIRAASDPRKGGAPAGY